MQITNSIAPSHSVNLWTQVIHPLSSSTDKYCLFISGAGAPAMFWTDEFCQQIIDAGYTVIRFDHRDQGLSDAVDWDKHPYTIDDLANDIIAILNHYKIPKAHIVGHSMGGMIAQWLAIKHAERLLSFTSISVSTIGPVGQPPKELMDVLMQNQPSQNFEADLSGFMRSWKILNGDYSLNMEMATNYTKDFYARSKHPVGVAWHHIWCQEKYIDLRGQLGKITVPGLFIHGEKDPLIPLQGAVETQKLVPHSKMIVVPDMGHMIFNRKLENIIASELIKHFGDTSSTG